MSAVRALLCDSCESLLRAKTVAILRRETKNFSKQLGFDRFAYVMKAAAPSLATHQVSLTDYRQEWVERYFSGGFLKIDPIVLHCERSMLPAIWDDNSFHARGAQDFWESAQSYGLRSGLTLAVHQQPGVTGILSFSRDKGLDLQGDDLAALVGRSQVFAILLHEAVIRISVPMLAPKSELLLTARERECLKWVAEGKTAGEISDILTIAERTVVFHIDNVIQKLGATNKTQAAFRALALKLLY